MKFMWTLAVASLIFFAPACGDDGGDAGGGSGDCESQCTAYQTAYNECGAAMTGDGWTDGDFSCSTVATACDYYDYGAYYECLTTNIPEDCAVDGAAWGSEVCTLDAS